MCYIYSDIIFSPDFGRIWSFSCGNISTFCQFWQLSNFDNFPSLKLISTLGPTLWKLIISAARFSWLEDDAGVDEDDDNAVDVDDGDDIAVDDDGDDDDENDDDVDGDDNVDVDDDLARSLPVPSGMTATFAWWTSGILSENWSDPINFWEIKTCDNFVKKITACPLAQDDNSHVGIPNTHDIYSLIVIQCHHHNYDGYYDDCYDHDLYYSFTKIDSENYSALCI